MEKAALEAFASSGGLITDEELAHRLQCSPELAAKCLRRMERKGLAMQTLMRRPSKYIENGKRTVWQLMERNHDELAVYPRRG